MMLANLFALVLMLPVGINASPPLVSFGIITDVHYADADSIGTRIYRDSLSKVNQAVAKMSEFDPDFMIELGDFKDTEATHHHCDQHQTPECISLTIGYLQRIEQALAAFPGARYHVIGNHDVDVLNQSSVFAHERDSHVDEVGGPGFYSWSFPLCQSSPCGHQPLRFITLNGDFTAQDEPWSDLDSPFPGESWDKANVPTQQRVWLARQLDEANSTKQHVIIFVHYRLDGGEGGPVGQGLGPAVPKGNRAWIDDCTLENADEVRKIVEKYPGQVLATFSGHDHKPLPPYTLEAPGKPLYFTHAGMIEGHFPASNAYSVVSVFSNCSIEVRGFANATSVITPGQNNCSLALA